MLRHFYHREEELEQCKWQRMLKERLYDTSKRHIQSHVPN